MPGSILKRLRLLFQRPAGSVAYIPEVDGLRFIAIAAVFFQHALFVYENTHQAQLALPGRLRNVSVAGVQGVMLFFALSGFILALPFARATLQGFPEVKLKPYYLRRITRLEPPYLIALTLLFFYKILFQEQSASTLLPHWVASAIYSHNFIYNRPSTLMSVAWSLEIEVQFYIVAPLLFRLFRCPPAPRRGFLVLLGLAAIIFRRLVPELPQSLLDYLHYFICGILIADLYVSGWRPFRGNTYWTIPFFLILTAALFTIAAPAERTTVEKIAAPILTGTVLATGLFSPAVRRLLSVPVLTAIGGMCYSIYLLHFLVIGVLSDYSVFWFQLSHKATDFVMQFLVYSIAAGTVCACFYLAVEKPFMAWRPGRLQKRRSVELRTDQ